MSKFVGILIRRERLQQSLSQEELCQGICAVSYLSKIEQGKADAGAEILSPLLQRLNIRYETDALFLSQAEKTIAGLYEGLFNGMEDLPAYQEKLNWLAGRRDRCMASPHMLDALLLLQYFGKGKGDENLEEFIACMTKAQYEFFLLLRLKQPNSEDAALELLRLNGSAFYTCLVGIARYREGRYQEAIDLLTRGYDQAAQEGNVYMMLRSKLYLGNCCSESGRKDLMLSHYQVARRLAAAVNNDTWVSTIHYRLAGAYLEWDMAEEAYALLQTTSRHDALYYHKLAVALEKLGRRNEAISALGRGRAATVDPSLRPVMKEMLDLVEYRLRNPKYLQDKAYSQLMTSTFTLLRRSSSSSLIRFHLSYMLEVLEAERRYKDAYRLTMEFSALPTALQ